ncbi:MAG: serine hydrolase [Bacteroidales bacterium]|nr:serine hydrolase [Bacteroidales bacterium]
MRGSLFLLILFFFMLFMKVEGFASLPENDSVADNWVDSVMSSLNLDEMIAQLMMIRTYSNKDKAYYTKIENIIKTYNIGGLCFFQGGPVRQAKLTNHYQPVAKTPLLIAIDAEWGLGMRLDSTFSFPFQMTIGAIKDNNLVYDMGTEIARQLKMLGVHINFAPVIDINNNPLNPVINSRSFGENRNDVADKGIAYMKGLQDNGIIATAKHFPGHGDTDSDSHYTLPIINQTTERLDSLELYPFKELINHGLGGVMVAHLFVPELDSSKNKPTTLSKLVVTDLLKDSLNFEGLVITDALDMKGVTSFHQPGEIEVKAFLAGNDILLLPQDVKVAISGIKKAIESDIIIESDIEERCRKILKYKHIAGLDDYSPVTTDSLYERLNNVRNELITRKIYESAITVVHNNDDLLPLRNLDTLKIATLSIGSPEINPFQSMLSNYCKIDHYNILKTFSEKKAASILKKLSEYNLVITSIHNTNIYPHKNFGITAQSIDFINKIADSNKVVLSLFASPYSLEQFPDPEKLEAIILGYQDNKISNEIAAQILMGSVDASGNLPVTTSDNYPVKSGIPINSINRLKYTIPEEVEIASQDLLKIDSIVLHNIKERAIPGCQILIAKEGKVVYQKSFGYHTYKKGNFVKNTDLYDLASITKVAATTLSIMKLQDEKMVDIDHKLVWYLPYLRETNKEDIIIREMMAHQARLKPWIPFYLNTIIDNKLDKDLYSSVFDEDHTVEVARNLYISENYKYSIYDSIVTSKLRKRRNYKYSDLGFYLLKQSIENLTNQPLQKYVEESFYIPLGLQTMCFNPLEKFQLKNIIPTEKDDYFRDQLIHGYVHDPGAAMLGGVSGHAGLFSNANDLAILMQMLLQGGSYGGKEYLNSNTISQFTKMQFPLNENRRGIGFDKPDPNERDDGPTCESVSDLSFGHTGFTGTYAWADPEYNLIYIFLSNRIHPTAKNTKLIKMNTRTEIQQVIYDAILKQQEPEIIENEIGALGIDK